MSVAHLLNMSGMESMRGCNINVLEGDKRSPRIYNSAGCESNEHNVTSCGSIQNSFVKSILGCSVDQPFRVDNILKQMLEKLETRVLSFLRATTLHSAENCLFTIYLLLPLKG